MTRTLSNWATAAFAIMALTVTLGLTATSGSAEARPAFAKYDGVDGEAGVAGKSRIKRGESMVCCSLPRPGKFAFLKSSDCRAAHGKTVARNKCPQAGAKASDAYFVKVDRETTTEARRTGPARLKRAGGQVCCSVPRRGRLALVKPSDCRKVKGSVVAKSRCARARATSARKFSNIVLKRGVISRAPTSKPGGPSSLQASEGQKSVYCANGNQYFPCWCEGSGSCNNFIAACVEVGGDLNCNEHNSQGQPTACSCYK